MALVVAAVESVAGLCCWPVVRQAARAGMLFGAASARRDLQRSVNRLRLQQVYEARYRTLSRRVVHDINNVLAGIMASADEAAEFSQHPGVQAAAAEVIANAREGLDIGRRFLASARLDPTPLRIVELNGVVRQRVGRLPSLDATQRALELRLAEEPLEVDVDPDHLFDALGELIGEIRAAAGADAAVLLRTRLEARSGSDGPLAAIDIEAKESVDIAGGPSTEPTPMRGAMSPAVSSLLQTTSGTLAVGKVEGGLRLTLRFPLREPGPAPTGTNRERQRVEGRVLVVEDNPAVRSVVAWGLARFGFTTYQAEDAASAEAVLSVGIDALVTDIVLPDTDGFALAREARARDPTMPLVFISGVISSRHPELLVNDDLTSFMRKPVQIDKLGDVVSGLLAARETLRRSPGRDSQASS
ncbi:MAG: hybrid sensor histidine kinase/response regulator [Acidisphaera sp.]|nr:hybrid sensor histidine kinase/response regulator [Acidisphaera sp.]